MPELPEVETIVRDLRPELQGRRIESAWANQPGVLRHPGHAEFASRSRGRQFTQVGRHGKFILLELDGGPELLVIHLGMTGRLTIVDPTADVAPHTHLRLRLSTGMEMRMQDPRRFGRVLLGTVEDMVPGGVLPRLGPEPESGAGGARFVPAGVPGLLTARAFDLALRRSRRPIKALLLDQSAIAGIGNIYADEALFRAGVRPTAISRSLGRERRRRLFAGISEALRSAVDQRGTTFSDYRDARGEKGGNQHLLLVYGRAGEPCRRCGRTLHEATVAGRSTVFCRGCQR